MFKITLDFAEVNGFNRFEITGPDAYDFLDRMFCGSVTRKPWSSWIGIPAQRFWNGQK